MIKITGKYNSYKDELRREIRKLKSKMKVGQIVFSEKNIKTESRGDDHYVKIILR